MAAFAYGWLTLGTYAAPAHRSRVVWVLSAAWLATCAFLVYQISNIQNSNIEFSWSAWSIIPTIAVIWLSIRHFQEEDKDAAVESP